jgi:hypothetical protein
LGKLPIKDVPESLYEPRFTAVDGAFLPPTKRLLGADGDGGGSGGPQGVPKLVYLLVAILAVGFVVTGLALVSTLLHANRLQDSLSTATTEIELSRSFRLLVRHQSKRRVHRRRAAP